MDRGVIGTTLRDGTPVLIRDVGPQDANALLEGFARLSPESRVFRFLRSVKRLQPHEVELFTNPDGTEHEAIGALVVRGRPEPAGIAHFFRAQGARHRAELALTVIDPYQRRGLGVLLLARLMRLASCGGITQFDAMVHSGNGGMVRILHQLGARSERDGTVLIFELPIHADPALYPDTRTGAAVRQAWTLEPMPEAA